MGRAGPWNLGPCRALVPTLQPIPTKICIGHFVSRINNCAKFGEHRIIRAFATWVWNITLLCVFIVTFPFLSFPFLPFFILAITYSQNAWTDSHGWRLKMRDWCKEVPLVCLNYARPFWGVVSLKNYPKKAQVLKSQPNGWSRITSERFKIDTKCQCNMNIKSGLPFQNQWWKITYGAP